MIDIASVYNKLLPIFYNHEHQFRNKYIFNSDWESDFFCVTTSGYTVEVEVKMSRADFRSDFKKEKHKLFAAHTGRKTHYVRQTGTEYDWVAEVQKCTNIKIDTVDKFHCPNKFFFACPAGLITKEELPKHIGLIHIEERSVKQLDGTVYEYLEGVVIKPAPFIHKGKPKIEDLLFNKYWHEHTHLKQRNDWLERRNKELEEEFQRQYNKL